MDNPGPWMCCGVVLVPAVFGALIGAWWQRRMARLGWPAALIPDAIRRKLEE